MSQFEAALSGADDESEPEPESDIPEAIGTPEEFKQVLDELDDTGRRLCLAESTARWMRLGEHAGRLRATCLESGLGEQLTSRLVSAYLTATLPAAIA